MHPILILSLLMLAACASRPPAPAMLDPALPHVQRVENRERVSALWLRDGLPPSRLPFPEVALSAAAERDGLEPEAIEPVLRELGRSLCLALAERLPLDADTTATLRVELVALRASRANAIAALLDLAVPGPGRLPAGLGGLSVRLQLNDQGEPRVLYAWSRGANPLRENARLSPIADAWQLAGRFAGDFLKDSGLADLPKRPPGERRAASAECEARFGGSDPLLRGAGRLLPLPPEWAEKNPPQRKPGDEPL